MKKLFEKYQDNIFLLLLLDSIVLFLFLAARIMVPDPFVMPLRNALAVIVSYTLRFNLALIVIFLFFLAKPLYEALKKVNLLAWAGLAIILMVGAYNFWFAAPYTHRVYFDEDIYMNIAANIS